MELSPTPIAQGVSEPGGKTIKLKVVDIGPWNMDTGANISINHGLNIEKIVCVNIIIFQDLYARIYRLDYSDVYEDADGKYFLDSTKIYLYRRVGGKFDNAAFNDPVINRGHIMLWYYE